MFVYFRSILLTLSLLTINLTFANTKLFDEAKPSINYLVKELFIKNSSSSICPIESDNRLSEDKIIVFPHSQNVITPYKYEEAIAKHNKLPLEQIVALFRNFHHAPVTDGSFGFHLMSEKKLKIIKDINLIDGYKEAKKVVQKNEITFDDIVFIRYKSFYIKYVKQAHNGNIKPIFPKLTWNSNKKFYHHFFLHPDVIERYKANGYQITAYNSFKDIKEVIPKSNPYLFSESDKDSERPYYSIQFPSVEGLRKNIENYAKNLTSMLQDKTLPPEKVVAYAIQELLIIHPFDNGNGRTARIIGQAIYEKLTGKSIIFPKEFSEELNYSRVQLEQMITKAATKK